MQDSEITSIEQAKNTISALKEEISAQNLRIEKICREKKEIQLQYEELLSKIVQIKLQKNKKEKESTQVLQELNSKNEMLENRLKSYEKNINEMQTNRRTLDEVKRLLGALNTNEIVEMLKKRLKKPKLVNKISQTMQIEANIDSSYSFDSSEPYSPKQTLKSPVNRSKASTNINEISLSSIIQMHQQLWEEENKKKPRI